VLSLFIAGIETGCDFSAYRRPTQLRFSGQTHQAPAAITFLIVLTRVSLSNGFEDRYAAAPTCLPRWTDSGSVAVAVEKITGIGAVAVRLNERAWIA
jgi:hypothetical protein